MAAPAGEQKRVMLWAPPRSLSTAFERCISVLNDSMSVEINHEMYTAACHLGPNRQIKIPYLFEPIVYEPKLSYRRVKKLLEAENAKTDLVFCKELAYSVDGKFDMMPDGYRHTFLIRHPAKVFLSFHNFLHKFPNKLLKLDLREILPKGLVFKELYDLMEHTRNALGQTPIVIDADDLVANPDAILRLYCQAVGLPYNSNMKTWRRCKDDLKEWTYSKKLMFVNKVMRQYDRAFSTPGLLTPTESATDIDINCLPRKIKDLVTYTMPFYEKMYECRLRPDVDQGKAEDKVVSTGDGAQLEQSTSQSSSESPSSLCSSTLSSSKASSKPSSSSSPSPPPASSPSSPSSSSSSSSSTTLSSTANNHAGVHLQRGASLCNNG